MKQTQATILFLSLFLLCPILGLAGESIVFGIDPTKPPMQYINQKGELAGFEIDLLKEMGRQGDFTPIFKQVSWQELFNGIENDQYDAACASISITDERKDQMEFTSPYYRIAQAILALPDAGISVAGDLKGKRIGIKKGTTSHDIAGKYSHIEAIEFPDIPTAIKALYTHEIDVILCDGPVAGYYAHLDEKKVNRAEIVFVLEGEQLEMYGISVKRGNKEVKSMLNRALQNIQMENKDIELQKKWFSGLVESR